MALTLLNPPPPTEAEMFERDDLEFRTITTLLRLLSTRDRITVDNFEVSREHRLSLKLLTALSSLLVRNNEVVAVMAKRSVRGTTLLVGVEAETSTVTPFRDYGLTSSLGSSGTSAPSTSSTQNYITRDACSDDPVGTVQLLKIPTMEVGADVFEFMVQNWHSSFEHHVQSFAYLLNEALANPDNFGARIALEIYALFQSAPKLHRRIRNSPRLAELVDLEPVFNNPYVPSPEDLHKIRAILATNENGRKLHTALYKFLEHPAVDSRLWLPEFHKFFKWFVKILVAEVKQLKQLGLSKDAPDTLRESFIDHVFNNLAVLRFFSWESSFFKSYIHEAFSTSIIILEGVAEKFPSELQQTVPPGTPQENTVGDSETQDEEDMGLDISTEFETGEDQASVTTTSESTDPCLLELRIISSNIQNLDRLLSRAPRSHFRFQVIQYPPSGMSMKPWREVIKELFPEPKLAKDILQALEDMPGKQFMYFRSNGPVLKFAGRAHCEAVLGCLFSITKRNEDSSWTGIPNAVLPAIRDCYNILAPSKRCCPVCATIISILSEEAVEAGGRGIHALSKHSATFPCALPVGLPTSVRQKLLHKYRRELRSHLTALLNQKRSVSAGSGQSDTSSQDGDADIKSDSEQDRYLRVYKSGWDELDQAARKDRWQEAGKELSVEQLQAWWAEMDEDMKVGLLAPVALQEMANLTLVSEAQA